MTDAVSGVGNIWPFNFNQVVSKGENCGYLVAFYLKIEELLSGSLCGLGEAPAGRRDPTWLSG